MYRNEGLSWIREHPARAGRLHVSKVLNTFSVQQWLATESEEPSPSATSVIAVTYLPVLLLFLIRPIVFRRVPLRKGEGLLLLAFWSNVAVTAIAFTRIRFRVPIDPLMVIVAATFLTSMLASSHLGGDSSSEEANATQPEGVLGQQAGTRRRPSTPAGRFSTTGRYIPSKAGTSYRDPPAPAVNYTFPDILCLGFRIGEPWVNA